MTDRLTRPHMPTKLRSELAGLSRLMNNDRLDDETTERRLNVLGMFGPTPPEDDEQAATQVDDFHKERHPSYWWAMTHAKEYRDSLFKILQRAPLANVTAMLRLVEIEISINPPEDWRGYFNQLSYARFIACLLSEAINRR